MLTQKPKTRHTSNNSAANQKPDEKAALQVYLAVAAAAALQLKRQREKQEAKAGNGRRHHGSAAHGANGGDVNDAGGNGNGKGRRPRDRSVRGESQSTTSQPNKDGAASNRNNKVMARSLGPPSPLSQTASKDVRSTAQVLATIPVGLENAAVAHSDRLDPEVHIVQEILDLERRQLALSWDATAADKRWQGLWADISDTTSSIVSQDMRHADKARAHLSRDSLRGQALLAGLRAQRQERRREAETRRRPTASAWLGATARAWALEVWCMLPFAGALEGHARWRALEALADAVYGLVEESLLDRPETVEMLDTRGVVMAEDVREQLCSIDKAMTRAVSGWEKAREAAATAWEIQREEGVTRCSLTKSQEAFISHPSH
ncbi:hypothetical protein ColLi_09065 [Colletotrichum liriopes]|uniref:Uncharacterized protein n=1 Tax=Colletotrichum liriopes TaxID=708192 RepID=A0AA37GSL9_9PEZI|nr:hypothetical protein ColLi_09065 [Colletotrichum liriopes]